VRQSLRAEWAKAWSDPGTFWLLSGLVLATVAVSIGTIASVRCPAAGCGQDPARLSLTGIDLGQVVGAVAGVLAIGTEYGTGMIRVSLTAVPRRLELLAAKTLVLAGLVLAASAVAAGVSMLAGWIILPGHGFTPAHGFTTGHDTAAFGPGSVADWRAAFCSIMYLVLTAVLSLGVTAVVRDSAVAIGAVLGLLFLFPLLAGTVTGALQRHLEQISPLLAGQDLQATTGLTGLPLSPWPALGVVALWAAGALSLGGLTLSRRDA
jgi:ABC-2 type transport system permease protein